MLANHRCTVFEFGNLAQFTIVTEDATLLLRLCINHFIEKGFLII